MAIDGKEKEPEKDAVDIFIAFIEISTKNVAILVINAVKGQIVPNFGDLIYLVFSEKAAQNQET